MSAQNDHNKAIGLWLYVSAASIFLMAVIGAITRLTESGLSIAEWNPVMGALPPQSPDEWNRVFDLYKQTPQYKDINNGMSLDEFKNIFFWEWFHRLWGRMIGIIYAVPFFYFLARRRLPKIYLPSFWGFLLLGGLQGAMGWYMVQSGLVDNPAVSHYRLAAHLLLAATLYGLMLHLAFKLRVETAHEMASLSPLRKNIRACFVLTVLTMIWGAFVAGLDAGLIYNSFPMMGDYPWPGEGLDLEPLWRNTVENHATVQFIHRLLAITTLLFIGWLVIKSRRFHILPRLRRIFWGLGGMALTQVILGISALLSSVDIHLAVSHQAGAFLLLAFLIRINHEIPKENYLLGT